MSHSAGLSPPPAHLSCHPHICPTDLVPFPKQPLGTLVPFPKEKQRQLAPQAKCLSPSPQPTIQHTPHSVCGSTHISTSIPAPRTSTLPTLGLPFLLEAPPLQPPHT